MRVELSAFVENELEAIADYTAQDGPIRAVSFTPETGDKFHAISEHPLIQCLQHKTVESTRVTPLLVPAEREPSTRR